MPYVHDNIEYEVKREWSLDDLQTRLNYADWTECQRRGLVKRLLLEHPKDRRAYLATEYANGSSTVLPMAPGVAFNLDPPMNKPEKSKAGPLASYMLRKAEEAKKQKMQGKVQGGISDILKHGVRVEKIGNAAILQNGSAMLLPPALVAKIDAMQDGTEKTTLRKLLEQGKVEDAERCYDLYSRYGRTAPANNFPPSINSTWPRFALAPDGRAALYINFDRIFAKFRFVEMDSGGMVRTLPGLDEAHWIP
jgi:hypothetical protein